MEEDWKMKKNFIKLAIIFIVFVAITMRICIMFADYIDGLYVRKEGTIKIYGDKALIQFESKKGLKTVITSPIFFRNVEGDTITIYYLRNQPEKIRFNRISKTPIYVVGIAALLIILFRTKKDIDYYNNLIENGTVIEARVVKDTNPLLLKWEDARDQKTYYFVKRYNANMGSEPKEFMDVCINMEDPNQYYIMN